MGRRRGRRRGQNLAGLTLQQQEDIISSLHPELRRLNLNEIFPHLNQEGLLSHSEKEKLKSECLTTHEKIDELLEWIPTKGSNALARFIKCLRNSDDGTGHDELATWLEDEVRELKAELEQSSEGPANGRRTQPRSCKDMVLFLKQRIQYVTLTVAILVLVSFLMFIPHIHHRRVWVDYSSSLPDYVPHFLGRDKEVADLVKLLDPQNSDVRIVSIVGPPGFGKSSLAVHVGHEMIDKGVVVNYVNLDEVDVDGIPEKIIGNAGITTKNNSIDRLIKWARDDVKYPVVIILDNCDVILYEERDEFQKFLQRVRRSATTVMLKFLLTAKHKFNLLDEFEEYCLDEINYEASCHLLSHMARQKIDGQTCMNITKLTGNVPLALKVVGAILRTRTRNITHIINNLERKLLKTLNPSDLDQKVNVSLELSYKYLNERQRKLGQYLALFPGSFTVHDACIILGGVMDCDCDSITAEIEVLDHRSLLQSLGKGRYQFHKIIKEFFTVIKYAANTSAFFTRFLVRYGDKLYHMSLLYESDGYASALHTLGIEKHNFQYLLEHSEKICLMDIEQSLLIFESLQLALKIRFLTSQFTIMDLEKPFSDISRCLLHIIPSITGEEPHQVLRDSKKRNTVTKAMEVLIHVTVDFYGFGVYDTARLEEVKVQLDILENIINVPVATEFYYVLGSHYHALGELEKEKRWHEKMLQSANAQPDNCVPGSCDYNSISRAHFHLERYELGAYFLELDLKYNKEKMSRFVLLNTLELLHTCQTKVGNYTKAKATLERMILVLSSLTNASILDIYSNLEMLSRVTLMFLVSGKVNEATQLEEKQIMAIEAMNATKTRYNKSFASKASVLATTLLEAKKYDKVPEVAECALNVMKKHKKYIQETIKLQLIIGKAEYNNGKRSASIACLKDVVRTVVYHHPLYHEMAKEACQYMIAQIHVDITCMPIIQNDLQAFGYSVYMLLASDAVAFPTPSPNQQSKAFSTDIAPRSNYVDILPSNLAACFESTLNFFVQIVKYSFLYSYTRFSVTVFLHVINTVFISVKFFFFCAYCYRTCYFLIVMMYRMCRVCVKKLLRCCH